MGMFKFSAENVKKHLEDLKKKQEETKSKYSKKEKDISTEIILKVSQAGEYNFRAFPYIHNDDFLSDPFPDRFYHFGIPGAGTVFCPQLNTGGREKCAICDFVWSQMKENKGNKEGIAEWKGYLPKRRLLIPGILRGERAVEGIKFLSLSTLNEKPGKQHEQIQKWLQKESTQDFLDPENGYDMILSYESYDAGKSATLNGAKFGFEKIDLDRDRTPISKDPAGTWADIEASLPDVDKDIPGFEIKSYEDSLEIMAKWQEALEKKEKRAKSFKTVNEKKDTDGTSVEKTKVTEKAKEESQDKIVEDDDKPVEVEKKVEEKKTLTNDERRAKARELLKKAS